MAAPANSPPNIISQLLILIIISNNTPLSLSLSNSPQNIQTFYPSPSPPPPINRPPTPAIHHHSTAATPPPRGSSTRAAVVKAIGLTAAGTAALSALLFFVLLRRSRRNRIRSEEEENNAMPAHGGENPPPAPPADDFSRFNGNIKGLIVDENGLDVLYWKTVHENRTSFKKEYYDRDQAPAAGSSAGRGRKPGKPTVQEDPLLRGKSSSSQSSVWADPKEESHSSAWSKSASNSPPLQVVVAAAAPTPNKRSFSVGVGTSRGKGGQTNPNAVDHSKFDGDLMEALFGTVATNRKLPQSDNRLSQNPDKIGPPSQIFILEARKSQNISIVLRTLVSTRKEIVDSLVEGQGLNPDTIEKFTKIALTDEEASQITAFDGDPARLADAESFLYHLLKSVPSAFARFNAMLFKSNYDSDVSTIKQSLQSLELACNELRTRGLFLKLLEAVLKAGNRLSTSTSMGNEQQAFTLAALRKLSDVKSSDGKTTLLEFVVQEVVRAEGKRSVLNKDGGTLSRTGSQSGSNVGSQSSEQDKHNREMEYMSLGLPVFGGLSTEFSNVKKAATLDYELIVKSIRALSSQVAETRALVSQSGHNSGFARVMNGFLDTAELEMGVLREEESRVMELVTKTRDYYDEAGSLRERGTSNMLQVFVIVRDFLGMVDRVCADIARSVRSRKSVLYVASGSSSSPESPRVFRFPKLPANFMSEL